MKKIKYLLDYFKYLENPQSALRFKFGLQKNVKLKLNITIIRYTLIALLL